jgi:hypothetical protein
MRYGSRSVETSKKPDSAAKARARLPASPMCPSTSASSAPKARIVARIGAGVSRGAKTCTGSRALAP